VLAAGMRLGATPAVSTGVVFTIEPDLQTCPICMEPMSGAVSKDNPFIVLECQHAFHVDCISEWTKETEYNMRCPVCRVAITEKDKNDIVENELKHIEATTTLASGTVQTNVYYYRKGRLVRVEFSDGRKQFYEGEKGAERKVRVEFPYGKKYDFYEGEKGAERKVRVEYANGAKQFFEGEKGAERMVRVEQLGGVKTFYEGEKGVERLVRAELPDGRKQFYEGERGAQRLVRDELPDGRKLFYEGEMYYQRLVRMELSNGEKKFFEGERGAERLVRTEDPPRLDDARAKRLRTRALVGRREPAL
jgi:hypothetical protein